MLLEKSREIAPERMKRAGQNGNDTQFWIVLVKVIFQHQKITMVGIEGQVSGNPGTASVTQKKKKKDQVNL